MKQYTVCFEFWILKSNSVVHIICGQRTILPPCFQYSVLCFMCRSFSISYATSPRPKSMLLQRAHYRRERMKWIISATSFRLPFRANTSLPCCHFQVFNGAHFPPCRWMWRSIWHVPWDVQEWILQEISFSHEDSMQKILRVLRWDLCFCYTFNSLSITNLLHASMLDCALPSLGSNKENVKLSMRVAFGSFLAFRAFSVS